MKVIWRSSKLKVNKLLNFTPCLSEVFAACLCWIFAQPMLLHAQESFSSAALVSAATSQIGRTVSYDPNYRKIAYPGGDVPLETGVCSDVLVRAYRQVGIDLQKEVHADMQKDFAAYPSRRVWGLARPDTNIDHRRVLNLMTFFGRRGASREISNDAASYQPGDIVAWLLSPGIYHIGLVSDRKLASGEGYYIIHNIGAGAQLEDILFKFKIVGHFRYPRAS